MAANVGEYGRVHAEPWTERVSRIARSAYATEGLTESAALATVDKARKHGNLDLDAWFAARVAVVSGVGMRLN